MPEVIQDLDAALRALRTLQAPEQVQWDPADERWRVSSAAFGPQSDGSISVDLEEVQLRDGHQITYGYPRVDRAVGMVAHTILRLEQAGFVIRHSPVDGNDYHGEAVGAPSKGTKRALAAQCEIIIPLDGDEAERLKNEKLAREARKASEQQADSAGFS